MTPTEGLSRAIETLDSFGFDYGDTRVSLWRAVIVVAVTVAVLVFARIASVGVRHLFRRITRLDPAQQLLGEKIVSLLVWVITVLIGIDIIGIDLTALTVFSGAFGLAIGFGLQKTFGNLIAGIILLMDRSIKPGDTIGVNDGISNTVGQVKRIGIRAVSVVTRDKKEYLIPNENLMINQVENWSYSSRDVRIRIPVGVAYWSDIEKAMALMAQAARESERILPHPAPNVLLIGFGESAFQCEIRLWIADPEEGLSNVRSAVLLRLWRLFRENGIDVPYAQREVALKDSEALRALIDGIRAGQGER